MMINTWAAYSFPLAALAAGMIMLMVGAAGGLP